MKLSPTELAVLRLVRDGRELGDYVPEYNPKKHRGFGAYPVTIASRAAVKLAKKGLIERDDMGWRLTSTGQAEIALGELKTFIGEVLNERFGEKVGETHVGEGVPDERDGEPKRGPPMGNRGFGAEFDDVDEGLGGSLPGEAYDKELMDDPLIKKKSVIVPDDIKHSVRGYMRAMGLSGRKKN